MTDAYVSQNQPRVDLQFLISWSPARFMALGMIIYVVVLVIAPLTYDYSVVSTSGLLYAAGCYLAFFVGCRLSRVGNPITVSDFQQHPILVPDRLVNLVVALGAAGVAARMYDRVVLRGFTLGETYSETRESLAENVSAFGYVGGLGFSFGIIALFLIWLSKSGTRRPVISVFALLLALYPMAEAAAQGSRSTMLHTGFLFYFFARATDSFPRIIRSKLVLLAGLMAFAAISQLIYELRSLEGAGQAADIVEVYRQTALAQYSRPQAWVTEMLVATSGRGFLSEILKVITHFAQYGTHSWFVYFVNLELFQGSHGWGGIHFYIPSRVLSVITGLDLIYDPGSQGMLLGLSSTAMTLIYYDFGPLGPLMAGLFGYLVTTIHRKAVEMPARWLPLHSYLCFACLMSQIDNQLVGGLGVFAIWTFIGYVPLHYAFTVLSQNPMVEPVSLVERDSLNRHELTR